MGRINIGIGSDRGTSDRNDFGGILGEAVRYAKFPRNFSYIQGYYPLILSTFILKIIVPSFALFWSLGGINKYNFTWGGKNNKYKGLFCLCFSFLML